MHRRHLLATLPALALRPAAAQGFPDRPVTLMVPNGAGGTTDIAARILADGLAPRLGMPVVVENRPGANGALAAQAVLRARPDGHTLLVGYSGYLVGTPALVPDLPYDPRRDLAPVGPLMDAPHAVLVHPSVPARTLAELAALARARPGTLTYASTGTGSVQHLGTELFRQLAGAGPMTHVPYRAVGPAIADLLAGRVDVFVTTVPPVAAFARDGRLRALAVTASARSPALPEVPTAAEAGMPGLEVVTWNAVLAPAGTPRPVLDRLSAELAAVLATPATRARIEEQGARPGEGTAATLAERVARELAEWTVVARAGNLQGE